MKRRMFLFETDENQCPFSNSSFCNHPLRTGDKFCKTYGNLDRMPDSCELVEIDTESRYAVLKILNDIEDISYKEPDFDFYAWGEARDLLITIFGFKRG